MLDLYTADMGSDLENPCDSLNTAWSDLELPSQLLANKTKWKFES